MLVLVSNYLPRFLSSADQAVVVSFVSVTSTITNVTWGRVLAGSQFQVTVRNYGETTAAGA